jgi:hypothetical protein
MAALAQLRILPAEISRFVPMEPVRPQPVSSRGLFKLVLHLLLPRHVVEFVRVGQFWVRQHGFVGVLDSCPCSWRYGGAEGFRLVEVALVSFFLQIRGDYFVFPTSLNTFCHFTLLMINDFFENTGYNTILNLILNLEL